MSIALKEKYTCKKLTEAYIGQDVWVLTPHFPLISDTAVGKSFNLSVFLFCPAIKYKLYVPTA